MTQALSFSTWCQRESCILQHLFPRDVKTVPYLLKIKTTAEKHTFFPPPNLSASSVICWKNPSKHTQAPDRARASAVSPEIVADGPVSTSLPAETRRSTLEQHRQSYATTWIVTLSVTDPLRAPRADLGGRRDVCFPHERSLLLCLVWLLASPRWLSPVAPRPCCPPPLLPPPLEYLVFLLLPAAPGGLLDPWLLWNQLKERHEWFCVKEWQIHTCGYCGWFNCLLNTHLTVKRNKFHDSDYLWLLAYCEALFCFPERLLGMCFISVYTI